MWKVTLKGILGEEGPLPAHRRRGDARGRVHLGHVRAHRDDLATRSTACSATSTSTPTRWCGPRRTFSGQGFGDAGRGTHQRRPAPDGARRRRRRRSRRARCRGCAVIVDKKGDALGSNGPGRADARLRVHPRPDLSTIHVVEGRGPARAQRDRHRQEAAPTTPATSWATPCRSSPRPGATTTRSPAS